MTGKVQVAVLGAALALSGSGVQRGLTAIENNSKLLYLAAQYKMFTGDTETAVRLLQRATKATQAARVEDARQGAACPDGHRS